MFPAACRPYFYPPVFEAMYPPVAQTAIPPPEALTIPTGMPPIAWMACMGTFGEEPNFGDFDKYHLRNIIIRSGILN